MHDSDPLRATILKRITYDQDSTVIHVLDDFSVAFVEFDKLYYLIILQVTQKLSHYHKMIIQKSNRCPSIDKLLNSTILVFEILHRIKYFNKSCRERLALSCFYDDEYMCLCTDERHANYLLFNHSMKYTCKGLDYCQNCADCFQNNPNCPSSMSCICSECFYGSKCQFKTEGMSLSLGAILGYQIRPNMGIGRQSRAVKMNSAIVAVLFVLTMISSTLSLITFQCKKCQTVGCGLYLLSSSIVSLLISITLILKYIFLLLIQTRTITNRSFLMFNCMTIDVLLDILLTAIGWLNAFVAVERCIMVIKSVKFDIKTSRKMAKRIIILLVFIIIATYSHVPLHRKLMDDGEENRIWCVVSYSLIIQIYDQTKNLIHFLPPFGINISSAVTVIITIDRRRSNAHRQNITNPYTFEQFRHHKHLIISPMILVILALPRIILVFVSGCMKSARDPWLFLTGYFISFVPVSLMFIVFVWPSKTYKNEFKEAINVIQQRIKSISSWI